MKFNWRSWRSQALVNSLSCLFLAAVFVYANPFSRPDPNPIWVTLLGVWVTGLAAAMLDVRWLMATVAIVSLPFGLYFAISSPSVFAFIGVFTALYAVAAIQRFFPPQSHLPR